MIEDKIVRVNHGQAMSKLKRKLDGYRSHWSRFYIGVTSAPERRWEAHSLNGWVKMVLLYEAYSTDIAINLERDLIDYAHRCHFQIPPDNRAPGGEGIGNEQLSHYLYLLVG
jgi:hypothetical protein